MNIVSDYPITNTTVFLRCDLNVPIKDGQILDKSRITASLETIKYLIKSGAKVVITSHLGRPKGERNAEMSLLQICKELEKILDKKITFIDEIKSEASVTLVQSAKQDSIFMLENLRFYPEEEAGDDNFAQILANYGTVYVNDAFACSHRKHASIYQITKYMPSFAGLNLAKEIEQIEKTLDSSKRTLCIIGGSKISSKLKLVNSMIKRCEKIFIAGGMANTFFAAKGFNVGLSLCEQDMIDEVKQIVSNAENSKCQLILPLDVVVSKSFQIPLNCRALDLEKTESDDYILDCGTRSLSNIDQLISQSENVIWNGPLGLNEVRPFNIGSEFVARSIGYYTATGKIKSIVGGGDAVSCLNAAGVGGQISFVSTAGGAFLEYLEEMSLIGLEPLKVKIER